MINVFRLEYPLKIKAWRSSIFILHPTTFFQGFLNIRVATSTNKDLNIVINLVLLLPRCQISYVWEDDLFRVISLKEAFNVCFLSSRGNLLLLFLLRLRSFLIIIFRIVFSFLRVFVLLLFEPRCIINLIKILFSLFASLLLQLFFLLAIILHLLNFGFFLVF